MRVCVVVLFLICNCLRTVHCCYVACFFFFFVSGGAASGGRGHRSEPGRRYRDGGPARRDRPVAWQEPPVKEESSSHQGGERNDQDDGTIVLPLRHDLWGGGLCLWCHPTIRYFFQVSVVNPRAACWVSLIHPSTPICVSSYVRDGWYLFGHGWCRQLSIVLPSPPLPPSLPPSTTPLYIRISYLRWDHHLRFASHGGCTRAGHTPAATCCRGLRRRRWRPWCLPLLISTTPDCTRRCRCAYETRDAPLCRL